MHRPTLPASGAYSSHSGSASGPSNLIWAAFARDLSARRWTLAAISVVSEASARSLAEQADALAPRPFHRTYVVRQYADLGQIPLALEGAPAAIA